MEKEISEQDTRIKEQKDMDFYKSYFLIKSGQMDWYIYTQDKDWNIEIETNNKHIPDDYYIL